MERFNYSVSLDGTVEVLPTTTLSDAEPKSAPDTKPFILHWLGVESEQCVDGRYHTDEHIRNISVEYDSTRLPYPDAIDVESYEVSPPKLDL